MHANYQAVLGEEAEVSYLYDRWTLLPGDARSASIILEELLDAQERLSTAELAFTEARVTRYRDTADLFRALGGGWADENGQPLPAATGQPAATAE